MIHHICKIITFCQSFFSSYDFFCLIIFAASTLNTGPLNDITATILYDLLSVGGSTLFEKYGKLFARLLNNLISNYFGKIEAVTEEGCGGPVTRLKLFLEKAISTGAIDRPDGILRADFL